jgi:hypothetical protein
VDERGFDRLADGAERLDPKVCAQDLKALPDSAREVLVYVDEHVAHDAVEPTAADMPTYGDIHRAIDEIGEVFRKLLSRADGRLVAHARAGDSGRLAGDLSLAVDRLVAVRLGPLSD